MSGALDRKDTGSHVDSNTKLSAHLTGYLIPKRPTRESRMSSLLYSPEAASLRGLGGVGSAGKSP